MANHRLWPSILPDDEGGEFVDDSYQRAELERKDYSDLRQLAAEHPTEECHGRSEKDDIIDALVGKERL